jgi:hypothetical protein
VQRALVEIVDLALDHLGELVVADDDFVDEARQELAGVERPEAGLAVEGVDEALERRDRTGVDGKDDVSLRDQVDLATLQTRRILVVRLESLKRQMESVLCPGQLGATPFGRQSPTFGLWEVQNVGDGTERLIVSTIYVDPEELVFAELRDVDVAEVDRLVVAVRVEQPRRDRTQWTKASSAAAITAMTAVRYWRTSIARSAVGSASSILNGWWVLSVSIDFWALGS